MARTQEVVEARHTYKPMTGYQPDADGIDPSSKADPIISGRGTVASPLRSSYPLFIEHNGRVYKLTSTRLKGGLILTGT